MKTSSKIALSVFALGLTGLLAHTALAQFPGPGERGPGHRPPMQQPHRQDRMMAHAMAEYLGLNPEQREKMKALHVAQQAALAALHGDQALTMQQRREEARAVHKSFQEQRKALLTAEQQERAAELRAKVEQRVKHRMQQHMGRISQEETRNVLREFMHERRRPDGK